MSERNYSFEALAAATNTDWAAGRGELNIALKTIRAQESELSDYALADEIHRRAVLYREVMGEEILLTPTALAKHWIRVHEESSRPKKVEATNQAARITECSLCNGDRFVVVGTRPVKQTQWMIEKGIELSGDAGYEELAACPDCHPVDAGFRRYDGSYAHAPDPARVREMMRS